MNHEHKGQAKQVGGTVKAAIGEVTGKPGMTMKGKAENLAGKVEEKLGRAARHADERTADDRRA